MLLLKVHLYICVHGIGQVKFHVLKEYSSIDNDDELASLRPKGLLNTRMFRIKNPRTSNHLNSRSYNMPYVQNNFWLFVYNALYCNIVNAHLKYGQFPPEAGLHPKYHIKINSELLRWISAVRQEAPFGS